MDEKLKLLIDASARIAKEKGLNNILPALMNVTRELLEADRCSIFLHDKEAGELWTILADGVKEIRIPDDSGIAGHVCKSGDYLNIPDAYLDPRFKKEVDISTGYRTRNILAFPLKNLTNESIGVFQVINKKSGRGFMEEDINMLQHLTLYVASNIENTLLHEKLKKANEDVIYRLAHATKFKDPETQSHIIRVGLFGSLMAKYLGWNEEQQELVKLATPMHDIGKVGIPDRVLQKPGKLDEEEWKIMQTHSRIGHEILQGADSLLTQKAALTALEHHEKWNGRGYPLGKKGEEISLFGRFTALSDVFDALTSRRCYKPAWSFDKAAELLREEKGQHFDPQLTDIFLEHFDEIIAIKNQFTD